MPEDVPQPVDIPDESELFARFARRIHLFGLRHLRDADAADDLVQEVLLTTLEKLRAGTIRDLERLPSFVLGTCRMLVLNERRGQRRRAAILQARADEARPSERAEAIHPLDAQQLARCLAELSERARTVLLLTFYVDLASNEAAAELRTSAENVRILRHRSVSKLKGCMGSEVRA